MHTTKNNEALLQAHKLIEVARFAPSVHNTQPWHFRLRGDKLQFFIDDQRRLHAGDPTTRELWISIGIMFETIIQSAAALGILIKVKDLQTESLKQPVATITILPPAREHRDKTGVDVIQNRYTHRGELLKQPVDPSILKSLQDVTKDYLEGVEVIATHNKDHIELASKLTRQGLQLAFSSTDFRHELSRLIRPNWTKAHTGLPGFVLNKNILGAIWEKWSVWFNLGSTKKANAEARRVRAAPALLFIATSGDVPSHWFNAGRAYTVITLELTRRDLRHSTVAALVEAADFHTELEAALKTRMRLQCMLPIGYSPRSKKRNRAPRLTVDELLVVD